MRAISKLIGGLIVSACFVVAGTAKANVVYSYAGANFVLITDEAGGGTVPGMYATSMSVTGSFTFSSLAANINTLTDVTGTLLSGSVSDGRNTVTVAGALGLLTFSVRTDASANIIEYNVQLSDKVSSSLALNETRAFIQILDFSGIHLDAGTIQQCLEVLSGNCSSVVAVDRGRVNYTTTSGVWTQTNLSPVPVPAALPLFGTALAIMGLLGWHRRRQQAAAASA